MGMSDVLFELGLEWISKEDFKSNNWGGVWVQLLKSERDQNKILQMGLEWIRNIDIHHNSFEQIWSFLFKKKPKDHMLKTKALLYLSHNLELKPSSWQNIWSQLLKANLNKDQLVTMGFEFLQKNNEHGSWVLVWQDLYDENPLNLRLRKIGHTWLLQKGNERKEEWTQVWLKVYPHFQHDWQLRNKGIYWVKNKNNISKSDWSQVWLHIHKHFRTEWTVHLGLEWLRVSKSTRWVEVWIELLSDHNKIYQSSLIELGYDWIKKAREDNPSYIEISNLLNQYTKEESAENTPE